MSVFPGSLPIRCPPPHTYDSREKKPSPPDLKAGGLEHTSLRDSVTTTCVATLTKVSSEKHLREKAVSAIERRRGLPRLTRVPELLQKTDWCGKRERSSYINPYTFSQREWSDRVESSRAEEGYPLPSSLLSLLPFPSTPTQRASLRSRTRFRKRVRGPIHSSSWITWRRSWQPCRTQTRARTRCWI